MDTDLDFYTHELCRELRAAMAAPTLEQRRAHERLASAYRLQLQRLAHNPTSVTPELRLKPLRHAA